MLRNYFQVALRNIARHKVFSILNAVGLALGMSVSLLLISFYVYVSSFDDFHTKNKDIYRVVPIARRKPYIPASGVGRYHTRTGPGEFDRPGFGLHIYHSFRNDMSLDPAAREL